MAALSALYKYVLSDAPGCPEMVLDFNIVQAAIDFLRETSVYIITVPSFPIVANTAAYSHGAVTDLQLNRTIDASWNGTFPPLNMATNDVVRPPYSAQTPSHFVAGDDNLTFALWPTPLVNGTLSYRYSAYPTQTATTLPDAVVAQWGEAISMGAKSRILAIPDKPYTSPQSAAKYEQRFRNAINRARISRQAGYISASQRVQYQPFGA